MIILIGPSGCGKSTIEKKLAEKGYDRIISYTTRAPREGEIRDVSYHYIDKSQYKRLFNQGFFAEHIPYQNNYYGAAKKDLKENSVGVFEPDGFRQVKELFPDAVSFYINVPDDVRKERMLERNDNPEAIEKRLEGDRAVFEGIEKETTYVIDNINLEETVEKILSLIIESKIIAPAYRASIVGLGRSNLTEPWLKDMRRTEIEED